MKDPHDLLQKKMLDVNRVRKEIAALHNVISLLAEASDCAEYGLAMPPNIQYANALSAEIVENPCSVARLLAAPCPTGQVTESIVTRPNSLRCAANRNLAGGPPGT